MSTCKNFKNIFIYLLLFDRFKFIRYATQLMLDDFTSCFNKQALVEKLFDDCSNSEAKYQKLIHLGRQLPPLNLSCKGEELIVKGCQSIVYLHSFMKKNLIYFEVESEALISSGLAYLLVTVYNGELPETILKCPPLFIDKLGFSTSLTLGRSEGLANIYLRMKQEALNKIINKKEAICLQ